MSSTSTIKFNNQDYRALCRSLIRNRQKFVDPTFPPDASSINSVTRNSDLEWRRPTELVNNPSLVVNGIRGSDVMQGERGNAWFVTASASLTTRSELLHRVMPNYGAQDYKGQEFHPGIFQFVFSRHGSLYEVVVDDFLPTRKGRLVYVQSTDENEFWSALLEKAYAKLHGDYASLSQGRVVDAVASFVRGIPDHWDMRQIRTEVNIGDPEEQTRLAKQLQLYHGRQSLLLFSLQPDGASTRMGDWTNEGLVYGRGYILTHIQQVRLKDDRTSVTLLKFQNAWFDLEWSGAWSDKSPEWNSMALEYRDRVNYEDKKDGIFWMSLPDVLKQFTDIDICVVASANPWIIYTFHGEWLASDGRRRSNAVDEDAGPATAGGSYEYRDSYAANPQYLLTVSGEGAVNVSLCLEQGNPATACHARSQLEVGLDVFRAEINRQCRMKEAPRDAWIFTRVRPSRQPSALLRSTFAPGVYLVVPCTKEPGQEQEFTLRSYGVIDYRLEQLPEFVPRPSGCCVCCQWDRRAVTRLIITKITGVNTHLKQKDLAIKIRIDCEASDVQFCQSKYYKEDGQEKDTYKIDFKVLLYRHQLTDPIDIEIFCQSNISLAKQFVGAAAILDASCDTETSKETPLFKNSKELPVKLYCTVQSTKDLDNF